MNLIKKTKLHKYINLSSDEYLLKEEDALVLHGKKKYVMPENYRYWERKK